ncbi:P-loop containing nucleoside triphosphate hydrolase,Small GTP-binding protein domain,Small GTPase [Cinara cedri]|uniref:P-loop containing nucleoside triphosphate hydrolase,Small GTP-binding protein domain,Small GTPase n=1 Tax=Cinara cedri TaxID=506608 RepID=A0A5E4NBG8_9HEMI|nr:P-loop containing nucleoside triphosphate hydrolase,Small GTP-binding protein domain,Small GTPase [Cinara cedri]
MIEKKIVIVGDGASGKTCLLHVFFENVYPSVYVPTVFDNFSTEIKIEGKMVKLALWDTAGQEDYDRLRPLSYPNSDVVIICYSIDRPDSLINVVEKWIQEVRFFTKDVPVILVGNKKDLRDQCVMSLPGDAGVDDTEVANARRENEDCTVVVTDETDEICSETSPLVDKAGETQPVIENDNKTASTTPKKWSGTTGAEPMVVKEQGQLVANEIGAFAFLECSAKTKEGVHDVFVAAVKATRRDNKQCVLL